MATTLKPGVLNETFSEKIDSTNYMLARIAAGIESGGGVIGIDSPRGLQTLLRNGLISKALTEDYQLAFDQMSSVTASVSGQITAATVNALTFIDKMGKVDLGWFEFIYEAGAWRINGTAVTLAEYGITVTGTPAAGDSILVHVIGNELIFDVLAVDGYDVPSDPSLSHALSLGLHNCYTNVRFAMSEALFYVNPTTYPSGLPVGTYYITSDHGTYGGATTEDGSFSFATSVVVPAGGFIRHTTMGQWRSAYSKNNVISGNFVTYNPDGTVLETLSTAEGTGGTNLGTTSSGDPQYKTSEDLNFTTRCAYGSNRWKVSAMRQWLNSDAASGWYHKQGKFDFMPQTSPVAGFLYGLDPELLEVIGECKKRVMKHAADGGGYEDLDEKWFLQSMTEVGFGANGSVYETPVANGTPKTTAYPFWVGKSQADKIKYLSGAARYWWLRSAYPGVGTSGYERYVITSGALYYNNVSYANGAVPSCCII